MVPFRGKCTFELFLGIQTYLPYISLSLGQAVFQTTDRKSRGRADLPSSFGRRDDVPLLEPPNTSVAFQKEFPLGYQQ